MKKKTSKFEARCSEFGGRKHGFTLMEVILVLVLTLVISGIALPYFAGAYKGTKLRAASRTITRMARYARSMAILREETLTVVLNHETMEIYLGAKAETAATEADGELDQSVLKRLGYVDGDESSSETGGIEKEVHRFLPDTLSVREFEKDFREEDEEYDDLYLVRYFPNGQSEWFILELEDNRGLGVTLENDPISGKIRSEFTQ
ncbi:pilus assembly FimT family protein [Pontiella sulfatireligans]|uniref:pilus assembly FimT family protein n=1 Tax=Pontiella sulfatireligans TaxID=2750658 RepID=UPI0014447FCA|nr:prepilin-type N-terminal cleavage/methylation domain-containing protein [Pontiella sulfatireligans]